VKVSVDCNPKVTTDLTSKRYERAIQHNSMCGVLIQNIYKARTNFNYITKNKNDETD